MLLVVLTQVVSITGIVALLIERHRRKQRLQVLAERLTSMSSHCLTGLGAGLDAMTRGDFDVEARPRTTHIEVGEGTGIMDELERTFNTMLTTAQSGLESYNTVRLRYSVLMGRLDVLSERLQSLRSVCLTGFWAVPLMQCAKAI